MNAANDIPQNLKPKGRSAFSKFIIRGMATLLPAVLTLWLLVIAYGFVRDKIAAPINWGVQEIVLHFTDWPSATDDDYNELFSTANKNTDDRIILPERLRLEWEREDEANRNRIGIAYSLALRQQMRLNWAKDQPEIVLLARRHQLVEGQWKSIAIGKLYPLDLIGLLVAIILFYFAGILMSNIVGRRLKNKGEALVDRVPLIRRVYPAVKQVTDFFFGDSDQPVKFNRVVAVEYPRKGLWSVGLVTGDTMRDIQDRVGAECLTVFIPSSPTPFTGYVITVPTADTIDLNLTIEDALKFAVSGGVLVPMSQKIRRSDPSLFPDDNPPEDGSPAREPGKAKRRNRRPGLG
jgi:uncharacterized membrane protein